MDTKLAINILENTFKQKFDIERFEYFLTELFNEVEINTVEEKHFVKNTYKKYVNHLYNIGNYRCKYGERIGLYAVELSNESSRDRARTMQRNLIVDFMKQKHRDAALIAFYNTDSDDWRFSYIKKYFKFGENGVKEVLSAPRRHSFLVGPNEPNHTCQSKFLNLLISEDVISLEQIDEAFNIENVTDEFFKEYSDLVKSLINSLTKIKEADPIVCEEFDSKYIRSSDFAKKLMGQLVFMYFLQKKGWLGVEKGKDWGTGPKDFLRKIFNNCVDEGRNFFNDVLEPIFYKGFAEEVSDFHYSEFGYKVPFLNGALFEPINGYDWVKTDITLKNSIFNNIFKTFDRFNFTVKEDEPLEREVAVDPEMLGKVFESLLESQDRKQKGAFYTPREIVQYICQENLISYLETNTEIPEEDIRKFITKGYLTIEHIIKVLDSGNKFKGISYVPKSIMKYADELDNLLKNVKVIDPAVGSGAFPVGMMNEIVTARYILRLANNVGDIDFYQLKKETIANSLYGVDLELSATDVTKLRFWLSLIVDEENVKEIEPLPNLDNQIMCGNSVIDGYENVKLFDDELIVRSSQTKLAMTSTEQIFNKLEHKKQEFFNVRGPVQKNKLREEIKEIKWEFIEAHLRSIGREDLIKKIRTFKYRDDKPFFIWELEFSEIFKGENPGFDIVVGNPPYVRQEKITEIKPYLKKHYSSYHGKADLYVYFFEKGIKILKKEGIIAFISSNKFAKSGYGKNLRKLILSIDLKIYDDKNGIRIFKEASVDTCIIQLKKSFSKDNKVFVDQKYYIPQNKLNHSYLSFPTPNELDLMDKIINKGTVLKKLDIEINSGIKTGFNDAFIIDENIKNMLIKNDASSETIIKPLVRGRDIKQWYINYSNLYLIFTKKGINIDKFPTIKEYLNQFKTELSKRNKKSLKWYEIESPVAYYKNFNKDKIIYSETSALPNFNLDYNNYYLTNNAFLLNSASIDIKYLVGLLNSNLIFWTYKHIGNTIGKSGYRFFKSFIEQIPIIVDETKMDNMRETVDNIFYLKNKIVLMEKEKNYSKETLIDLKKEFEKNIKILNNLVYNIYNLNENEIMIIEKNLNCD